MSQRTSVSCIWMEPMQLREKRVGCYHQGSVQPARCCRVQGRGFLPHRQLQQVRTRAWLPECERVIEFSP